MSEPTGIPSSASKVVSLLSDDDDDATSSTTTSQDWKRSVRQKIDNVPHRQYLAISAARRTAPGTIVNVPHFDTSSSSSSSSDDDEDEAKPVATTNGNAASDSTDSEIDVAAAADAAPETVPPEDSGSETQSDGETETEPATQTAAQHRHKFILYMYTKKEQVNADAKAFECFGCQRKDNPLQTRYFKCREKTCSVIACPNCAKQTLNLVRMSSEDLTTIRDTLRKKSTKLLQWLASLAERIRGTQIMKTGSFVKTRYGSKYRGPLASASNPEKALVSEELQQRLQEIAVEQSLLDLNTLWWDFQRQRSGAILANTLTNGDGYDRKKSAVFGAAIKENIQRVRAHKREAVRDEDTFHSLGEERKLVSRALKLADGLPDSDKDDKSEDDSDADSDYVDEDEEDDSDDDEKEEIILNSDDGATVESDLIADLKPPSDGKKPADDDSHVDLLIQAENTFRPLRVLLQFETKPVQLVFDYIGPVPYLAGLQSGTSLTAAIAKGRDYFERALRDMDERYGEPTDLTDTQFYRAVDEDTACHTDGHIHLDDREGLARSYWLSALKFNLPSVRRTVESQIEALPAASSSSSPKKKRRIVPVPAPVIPDVPAADDLFD